MQIFEMTENQDLSTHPLSPMVKPTITQRFVNVEQTQLIDRLLGTDDRKDRISSKKEMLQTIQM